MDDQPNLITLFRSHLESIEGDFEIPTEAAKFVYHNGLISLSVR